MRSERGRSRLLARRALALESAKGGRDDCQKSRSRAKQFLTRHKQSAPQCAAPRVLVWRFSRASTRSYRAVLPAALAFFHRALASAESLARAAALMVLFVDRLAPLILAHLALAAAAILARTAGLLLLFLWGALPAPSWAAEPRARTSSAWRESIRSFISAALLSCCEDRVISDEFIDPSLNRLQGLSSSDRRISASRKAP